MAPKRARRSAEDLANEHAKKSLNLRENVAREKVIACMRFEPACIASVLDSLRDIGTLDRFHEMHPPKNTGMLALEDDPDTRHKDRSVTRCGIRISIQGQQRRRGFSHRLRGGCGELLWDPW